mgnify:CR=1 FL=1
MINTYASKNQSVNFGITFLKVLFISLVIILHCFVKFKDGVFLQGAYIYVDFFFIIQGYYLELFTMKIANDDYVGLRYFISRVKKFALPILFQTIAFAALWVMVYGNDIKSVMTQIMGTVVTLSFVGLTLPVYLLNNGTIWFISAYVIAGTIMVIALSLFRNIFVRISPGITFLLYNYIITNYGNLDVFYQMSLSGMVMVGVIRGVAGISAGIFVRQLMCYFSSFYSGMIKSKKWIDIIVFAVGGY